MVLTRFPGETLEPLHNAHFANRLNVTYYISLHFYQETTTKPRLYIYHFSYGDDFIAKTQELTFYPYDKAHIPAMPLTHQLAHTLQQSLAQKSRFDVHSVVKLPFKPLMGIKAPAIALEIGLVSKDDWHACVDALTESIQSTLIPLI